MNVCIRLSLGLVVRNSCHEESVCQHLPNMATKGCPLLLGSVGLTYGLGTTKNHHELSHMKNAITAKLIFMLCTKMCFFLRALNCTNSNHVSSC